MTPDRPHDNLTEAERELLEDANYRSEYRGLGEGHGTFAAVESIIAARTSDLIERLQTAEAAAEIHHAAVHRWEDAMTALRDGIRQVIKDRASGDFAPILPKLRALLDSP